MVVNMCRGVLMRALLGAALAAGVAVADVTGAPVDFTLAQLGGGQVSLADLRGKWVVLNYWATWCAPCRKEIPELSELHSEREDLVVLGLAYEEAEADYFEAFLDEFEVTYPILLVDVYAPPEPFGAPRVMPTTIVLDRLGRPVRTFVGPVTREMLEAVAVEEDCP